MSVSVHDRDSVLSDLIVIMTEMTSDWDTDLSNGFSAEQMLMAEIGFQSIDWVYLVASIEQRYERTDIPFVELFVKNGKFVGDLSIGAVTDFLVPHLNRPAV